MKLNGHAKPTILLTAAVMFAALAVPGMAQQPTSPATGSSMLAAATPGAPVSPAPETAGPRVRSGVPTVAPALHRSADAPAPMYKDNHTITVTTLVLVLAVIIIVLLIVR